jgi:hypothetical protein
LSEIERNFAARRYLLKKSRNMDKLDKIITESINDFINEDMLNQKMSLNEMAQVNLRERGNNKYSFDSNVYYVYVRGEGGFRKFPHFHIKHRAEGWDIRMNLDGTFNSIKTKSHNRQNDQDFADIEKIAINWVKAPNTSHPKLTNGELAEIYWDGQNS